MFLIISCSPPLSFVFPEKVLRIYFALETLMISALHVLLNKWWKEVRKTIPTTWTLPGSNSNGGKKYIVLLYPPHKKEEKREKNYLSPDHFCCWIRPIATQNLTFNSCKKMHAKNWHGMDVMVKILLKSE